jgi:predicted nucleic acid-binding Zn ribbon protein
MWNQEELNNAIGLAKEGKTYDDIGKILNKSGHSIKCKFLRNGIVIKEFKKLKKYEIIKCLNCGKDVKGGGRKFCDNSCSAIYNNKKKKRKNIFV